MTTIDTLLQPAAIGAVAGLRAMTAPAAVAATTPQETASPWIRGVLFAAALGELVADKLPSTPNRVSTGPLLARVVSGAVCGALVARRAGQPVNAGAMLGSVGAIAGAFAGFRIRRWLVNETGAPDLAVAAAEDTIAISSAAWLASRSTQL